MRQSENALLFLVLGDGQARRSALAQQLERLAEDAGGDLRFLVALRALLGERGNALLEALEVAQQQFGLDHFGVGDRIDLVGDMLDIVILEAAQDVDDRVDFADVAEELVAEAFALGRALHQPGDVDERQLGRDDLGRTRDPGQRVEPGIGDRDLPDIGFDRAERIIGRLRRLSLGQRIEQGRLADVGQADDTAFEAHDSSYRGECERLSRALPRIEAGA